MKDYTIQQGETLRLTVTVNEEGADTAELVAVNDDGAISNLVSFDGMVADLTMNVPDNQAPGKYPYFIRIKWDDGTTDILTKNDDCEGGECPMPVITVCELPTVGS